MSFPYLAALSWRATTTQYASTKTFNVGQKGMTEDGSQWRLCKAGTALTTNYRAKINYNDLQDGLGGAAITPQIASAIAVGDVDFTVTDGTNARAADYYKGGYVIIPNVLNDNMRHIWKSDAEVSDTYKIHVTAPFTVAYASGTIHVYPSPWGDVRMPGDLAAGYEHFVCIIAFPVVDTGKYFWGQVTGPHYVATGVGVYPGAASEDRHCTFHTNGTIDMLDRSINGDTSPQIAGYLMFSGTYGDNLIYLQIE